MSFWLYGDFIFPHAFFILNFFAYTFYFTSIFSTNHKNSTESLNLRDGMYYMYIWGSSKNFRDFSSDFGLLYIFLTP